MSEPVCRHFADCIKRARPGAADKRPLDEVVVPIGGANYRPWRAGDAKEDGLDIPVQKQRSAKAAKRFFQRPVDRFGKGTGSAGVNRTFRVSSGADPTCFREPFGLIQTDRVLQPVQQGPSIRPHKAGILRSYSSNRTRNTAQAARSF